MFGFLFGLSDLVFSTSPAPRGALSAAGRAKLTSLVDAFDVSTPDKAMDLAKAATEIGRPADAARAYAAALSADADTRAFDALTGLVDADIAAGAAGDALRSVAEFEASHAAQLSSGAQIGGLDAVDAALLRARAMGAAGDADAAASLYDSLIAQRPEDFRPLLAKGLALKQAGRSLAADKILLQARYLAPKEARGLVDNLIGDR